MMTSEISLLDANVLVYAADETSPQHEPAKDLREKGLRGEVRLCIRPQVLYEFIAIITDPRRVLNPRSKNEALQEMEKYFLSKSILKIYSGPGILERILDLLKQFGITKQDIFDLQLVATMLSNSFARLHTFNVDDFAKFKEIKVLSP